MPKKKSKQQTGKLASILYEWWDDLIKIEADSMDTTENDGWNVGASAQSTIAVSQPTTIDNSASTALKKKKKKEKKGIFWFFIVFCVILNIDLICNQKAHQECKLGKCMMEKKFIVQFISSK